MKNEDQAPAHNEPEPDEVGEASEGASKSEAGGGGEGGGSLWDAFKSLKLGLFLLILIAAASVIGTVIPQGQVPPQYIEEIGQARYRFYLALGFFDLYHSAWFTLLLALLSLNLIACSLDRLPRILGRMAPTDPAPPKKTLLRKRYRDAWEKPGLLGKVEELGRVFASRTGKPIRTAGEDGSVVFHADAGRYSRLGVFVIHSSIILIIAGALIGKWFGFTGAIMRIPEGGESNEAILWQGPEKDPFKIQLPFTVRCDAFKLTYYKDDKGESTGRPKEYRSTLSILQDGRKVLTRDIIVNDPLDYEGYVFYQSSYEEGGVAEIEALPNEPPPAKGEKKAGTDKGEEEKAKEKPIIIHAATGETFEVPGSESTYRIARHFDGREAHGMQFGEGLFLHWDTPDGKTAVFSIFKKYSDFDSRRGEPYYLVFKGFKKNWVTGLQVTRDPGVWVVWAGCMLLILGMFVAFFWSHKVYWLRVDEEGMILAGAASRNLDAFRERMERLMDELKDTADPEKSPSRSAVEARAAGGSWDEEED